MKKTVLLLSMIAMVSFTSCSSDGDNNNNDGENPGSGALVQRVEFDYPDDDYSDEIVFTYNGNKLVKGVYTDGSEDRYFYTGDRITKIEYVTDGTVEARELFTYDAGGMLTEYRFLELDWNFEERSTFEATGANTVLETYYSGEIDAPEEEWTAVLTVQNNEIVQKVQSGFFGDKTYTFTYDTKNSPFKNVTGYGAIAYVAAGDHEFEGFSRNILSIYNDTDEIDYTVNTYTYNSDDYPATVTSLGYFDGNETTYTMNATFFYN